MSGIAGIDTDINTLLSKEVINTYNRYHNEVRKIYIPELGIKKGIKKYGYQEKV